MNDTLNGIPNKDRGNGTNHHNPYPCEEKVTVHSF